MIHTTHTQIHEHLTHKVIDDHSYFMSVLGRLDDNITLRNYQKEIAQEINACLMMLDSVPPAIPQH